MALVTMQQSTEGLLEACRVPSAELGPLSAEELSDFVVNGYLVIPPPSSLPQSFHKHLYAKTLETCTRHSLQPPKEPRAQHDLWLDPDTVKVFNIPEVHRALEGVLGPNYVVLPHRHMHTTSSIPGEQAMVWHQDPSWFPSRTHRPRQVLLMYYPGDVTEKEGPTSLLPGTQYMGRDGSPSCTQHYAGHSQRGNHVKTNVLSGTLTVQEGEQEIRNWSAEFNAGSATPCSPFDGVLQSGSFIMNHYDIIHRGTPKHPTAFRPMYKWLVVRTSHPSPSLELPARFPDEAYIADGANEGQLAIWRCMWDYLVGGCKSDSIVATADANIDITAALTALDAAGEMEEIVRLGGAYRLARAARHGNSSALAALMDKLQGVESARRAAMYGLAEAGSAAMSVLLPLIEAPLGSPTDVQSRLVRSSATYALGETLQSDTPSTMIERIIAALFKQLYALQTEAAKTESTSNQMIAEMMGALDALNRPWARRPDIRQLFQDNPIRFLKGLKKKDPTAWAAIVGAKEQATTQVQLDNSGNVSSASSILLDNTYFALFNAAQIVAQDGKVVETFVSYVRKAALQACSGFASKGTGTVDGANLLSLATVAVCTAPGVRQEARLTRSAPPAMNLKHHLLFFALALARREQSHGKAQDDIIVELRLLMHDVFGFLKSQNKAAQEPEMLDRFSNLIAGDVNDFYTIGSSADVESNADPTAEDNSRL